MNSKSLKIISGTLAILISLMLLMSGTMKLIGAEQVVTGLSAIGLSNYIVALGLLEIIIVILFLIPRTHKIGFLLLCSYLGGAASIELATNQFPIAFVFIALAWISVFIKDKQVFVSAATNKSI